MEKPKDWNEYVEWVTKQLSDSLGEGKAFSKLYKEILSSAFDAYGEFKNRGVK